MILLTGAAGYIGSYLMKFAGGDILGVDSFIKGRYNNKVLSYDINNVKAIETVLKAHKVDAIINLAAIVGDPACAKYPKHAKESNYEGVVNLLRAAEASGTVKKFVQASTCSVYGMSEGLLDEESPTNPLSLYAELKLKAEEAIRESGIRYAILRFSTAFGWSPCPRFDLTINEFTRDALHGQEIEVYRKDDWRPYAHIVDLASVCLEAAGKSEIMGRYNVGWDRNNHTKQMIIDTISKYIPINAKYVDAPGNDARNYKVDFSHLGRTMGWPAFETIDDGILEIIENLKAGGVDAYSPAYRADHLNC
jgi:nucleoside-diphosphate-sugar epimerase